MHKSRLGLVLGRYLYTAEEHRKTNDTAAAAASIHLSQRLTQTLTLELHPNYFVERIHIALVLCTTSQSEGRDVDVFVLSR